MSLSIKKNVNSLVEAAVEHLARDFSGKIIVESEDKAVTKKIEKMDPDAYHIASHGTQHAYGGGHTDQDTHVYHVHDTATGKTSTIPLEHAGKAFSHAEVKKQAPANLHPSIVKAIHADHKDNIGGEE